MLLLLLLLLSSKRRRQATANELSPLQPSSVQDQRECLDHRSLHVLFYSNKWTSTPHRRNVYLRHYILIGLVMTLTFDIWPWELLSSVATHMMNNCGKFHWNLSTRYKDIASREIAVNGRPDGQTEKKMPSPPVVGGGIKILYHVQRSNSVVSELRTPNSVSFFMAINISLRWIPIGLRR